MNRPIRTISLLLSLSMLAACMEPKYVRPTVQTPPDNYKERDAQWKPAQPSDSIPRGKWWEMFGDVRLNRLEEQVMNGNQSLQQSEAQFRQSRAAVSSAFSGFFPAVTLNPAITRTRSYSSGSNTYGYGTLYEMPGTASWEPDFWGQVRLSVNSAKGSAQASAAQLENAKLSLAAQLAADYFSIETIDKEEIVLSSATVDYKAALDLTSNRFNAGVASQADVAQAQSQLSATQAQATDLLISRAQLEHAIAVIVGESPSSFKIEPGVISSAPPEIPTGMPSQLLERRPDIAAAERQVYSANEDIGAARAAYFPVVSIIATGGLENATATQWFEWPSRFFSLGVSAADTIIDFGKHQAGRKQAWAAYDASVSAYRETVLTAFQQVEDDLAALRLLAIESEQEESAFKAAQDSLRLTMDQYTAGTVSYMNVIQAQNTALTSENTTVQILGKRMTYAVDLLRDLGGGWDSSMLPAKGGDLRATYSSGSHLNTPAH